MNTDELLKLKKLLDEGAISQEEFEREKSKLFSERESKKKNKGLIIGVICIAFFCICILSSNFGSDNSDDLVQTAVVTQEKPDIPIEFSKELPINVSGKM